MEPLSVALIIGLGGSFLTVWLTNLIGGRLEVTVQQLSHTWVQWPQRVFMTFGIILFTLVALNYYFVAEYDQDIFTLLRRMPLINQLEEPLRWFFSEIGAELKYVWAALIESPKTTPMLLIVTVLFWQYVFLSLFGVKVLQKLLITFLAGFALYFLMRNNFKTGRTRGANDFYMPVSKVMPLLPSKTLDHDQKSDFFINIHLPDHCLVISTPENS